MQLKNRSRKREAAALIVERGERSEVRVTEVRRTERQRSETSGQKSAARNQRPEISGQKSAARNQKKT
jgi:hypothetical protein